MFYPSPTEALTQFVNDHLPLGMLMRAFLEYQDWRCLGTRSEEQLTPTCAALDESSGQNLILFSDTSALAQAEKSGLITPKSPSFKLSPAEHHQLIGNVSGIWFNPGSEPAIKLEGDDFKTYQSLAQGIEVERCLAGVNENPDFNGILRKYRGWWIILVDGTSKLLLMPDDQGRAFAAVFSAWDAVEAAVKRVVEETEYKNPAAIPMTGAELFSHMEKLDIEGMIFNCAGPLPAHSFSKKLASEVLEEA